MHRRNYPVDAAIALDLVSFDKAPTKERKVNDTKHKKVSLDKNKRKPRDKAVGISDTLVTRRDGTQYVIARRKSNKNGNKIVQKSHAQLLHERMMALPTIHEVS